MRGTITELLDHLAEHAPRSTDHYVKPFSTWTLDACGFTEVQLFSAITGNQTWRRDPWRGEWELHSYDLPRGMEATG